MRSRKLSDLRADVRWLTDNLTNTTPTAGNPWLTDFDLTERINQGIAEIFSILVGASKEKYFRNKFTFTTSSSVSLYDLPGDFFDLTSVEIRVGNNDYITLTPFTAVERPYLASTTPGWSGEPLKYAIQGKHAYDDVGQIELLPVPSSNIVCVLYYVWAPTRLADDEDTFDGVAGFEDYAVLHAAKRVLMRGEQWDAVDRIGAEMERVKENIVSAAPSRDAFMPPKIQMVRHLWNPRSRRRRWGAP